MHLRACSPPSPDVGGIECVAVVLKMKYSGEIARKCAAHFYPWCATISDETTLRSRVFILSVSEEHPQRAQSLQVQN